jgi:opacity protein-like surface antigen
MQKTFIAAALAIASISSAHAADAASPFRFVVGAGLTFGGDNLVSVPFTDGSTEDINAGGFFHLYGGGEYAFNDAVAIKATVGYHVDDTKAASNGSVRFSRVPVDIVGLYRVNEKFRVGAGVQIVNGPELKGSGVASNINAKFKNATGTIIEGEYFFAPKMSGSIRYVSEKFEPKSGGSKVDGSHIGVMFNAYF